MGEAAPQARMTVEEFLRWDGEPDVRYELIDGIPVAMNPPWSFHRTIVVTIAGDIRERLRRRRPWRVEAEAGIWISDDDYWVADLAVTCSPPRDSEQVEDPSLIIEVLSKSTRGGDLGRKVPDFQDISSVQEIWAVDSERRRVWVYRRESDHWRIDRYVGSATFGSAVVEGSFSLDDIYENTDL
jgi:Uma2 family endonuclease